MNKVLIYFIWMTLLFPGCFDDLENDDTGTFGCYLENAPDAYDYPVIPGTPEWAELTSGSEMDSACMIPDDILSEISTAGLVETVLNYPLFGNLFAGSTGSYQISFESLTKHFNGFRELFSRNDAALNLLERYKLMYPGCLHNNYSLATVPVGWRFAFIEILLVQYEIINQLNQKNLESLLDEAVKKYEEKKLFEYSVMSSQLFSMAVAGRIMYISNYAPFIEACNNNSDVKNFMDHIEFFVDTETLEMIYGCSLQFLKN
ncbi:MAG: hypothetical protein JXB19_11020 [Bacteroidales bacterium]|nr:hypothetical protein [Bacteroidales bacterium]